MRGIAPRIPPRRQCKQDIRWPDRRWSSRPSSRARVNVAAKRLRLADATTSPRETAAATATAAATTATTAPAATTASAATAAPSPPSEFLTELGLRGVFLVEDIESRQAHVGDFFLAEKDFVRRREILRLDVRSRSARRCGCYARQREGYASYSGNAQRRQGLPSTGSLRSLLRTRHLEFSLTFEQMFR
jgi:hypothetical protein